MKKKSAYISMIASVMLFVMMITGAGDAAFGASRSGIDLIGHRGYSGKYPENTMAAFRGAYKNGFEGIEVDIWESDNGDLMIFHDENTKDLTGRSAKIWKVNSRNRKKFKVRQKGRKELIPTLQEVLRYSQKTGLTVLLHVKNCPKHHMSKKGAARVAGLIKKYKVEDRVVVFASSAKVMKKFRGKGVRLGRLCTSARRKDVNKTVAWLVKNKGDTLILHKVSKIKKKGLRRDIVKYCHKRNIQIGTYWTYNKKELKYLRSIGADFAMSNYRLKK